MSVRDLTPEGFSEAMAWYARISKNVRVFPQAMDDNLAVWLDVDGCQTMIGYGTAIEAVQEAQAVLRVLSESIPEKVHELLSRA